MTTIGILLTNTGTPDQPTKQAVRAYLRDFLSDKRIVKIPRLIWLPILYGLILTTRPAKSAKLYQKIWTPQGSPMRYLMQQIRMMLQKKLNAHSNDIYVVELGMNYGNPSIQLGLDKLRKHKAAKIIVLPLFPQYSDTTTAASYDRIKFTDNMVPIHNYASHPDYIDALAKTVQTYWSEKGKSSHLLISFHGIPQRFAADGDPYANQCELTAKLLAQTLQLTPQQWTLCYQSQFGYDKWLQPSTQALFNDLPQRGIKQVDVICPGFAVDCLETLEEIAIRGQETFLAAGGESLRYIPALNDSPLHIEILHQLIIETINNQ